MTKLLLAISLLPLAVLVGCGDPDNCTGNECNDDDDTGPDPDDFSATLRSVAPYGWVGDHRIEMIEPEEQDVGACTATSSCEADLVEVGKFELKISGDTFVCVPQIQLVDVNDDGATVDVTSPWTGEGICGLAPEGEDDGWDVFTDVSDQVWIHIDNNMAVVTNDTFFFQNDEYLLEGTITLLGESFQVYFHRVGATGETERTLNIPLEN